MSVSSIIIQQCAIIEEQKSSITIQTLKECLDTIVAEMNKRNLINDANTIIKVLTLINKHNTKLCSELGIVDHQLFIILRDYYLDILRRWRNGQILDKVSNKAFLNISLSFTGICSYITDENVATLKKLLIYKPLADEITGCLTDIATNGKYVGDSQIKCVDLMMRAIYQIFQGRVEIQNDPVLVSILDAIVKCLCSSSLVNILRRITDLKELDEAETLLLDTCTDYFSWYSGDRRDEFCYTIRTALLSPFTQWLLNHVSSFREWDKISFNAVKKLGNILLDFDMHHDVKHTKEIYDDCFKIIDCFISILFSLSTTLNDNFCINYAGIFLLQLYLLTLDQNILSYIKAQDFSMTLIELANANNEYIQFNAYRILASILTEQDIKTLANPSKIASVFLTFLNSVIDDSSKILRLRNILRSLKNLVQHDQIKTEFLKQSHGLPLLLRCATESRFDPTKVQLSALEIIMSLSFNDEIAAWLRQNQFFIQHLQTLTSNSNMPYLQKAADGILWELFSKYGKTEQEFQYDIMISYSHKDREICHQIHKALTANKFRVWLDQEEMHGAMMQVMADAVENSRCILICMSEAYYSSPYCQSEAQYAYEKRRVLIPVKVQSGYKPDGWLAFLISGRIYVDFHKRGFDTAFTKIVSEIQRSQAKTKDFSTKLLRSTTLDTYMMRPKKALSTSNQCEQINSESIRSQYNRIQSNIETNETCSSMELTVANLTKRVELIDNRLEQITESLNWIMTAMARVRMAKDDPPLIE